MEHYFSYKISYKWNIIFHQNEVFPMITARNDDITLKIFITLYFYKNVNIFIIMKTLILKSQTYTVIAVGDPMFLGMQDFDFAQV